MTPKDCEHIAHLLFLAYTGEASPDQQEELSRWLKEDKHHDDLYQTIMDHERIRSEQEVFLLFNQQRAWAKISQKTYRKSKILYTNFLRYAAVFICFICVSVYFLYPDKPEEKIEIAELFLEPISSKAILQNEQDVRISLPGQCYSIKDSTRHKKQLETSEILRIYVPKGGEFELVLADGTRVWMNSETELKFPRAFTGDKRQVELVSGEAYFDVRKDKTKPFIVRNKDLNLTVLGTQFNIQNYSDEHEIITTLVEGAVQLSSDKTILHPGEQATYNKATREVQVETVDTELFTAWREGRLIFKSTRLETVLKQLSRWYDVKFVYEEERLKDLIFSGKMKKYDNGNVILGILKATGKIDFIQQVSVIHVKRQLKQRL